VAGAPEAVAPREVGSRAVTCPARSNRPTLSARIEPSTPQIAVTSLRVVVSAIDPKQSFTNATSKKAELANVWLPLWLTASMCDAPVNCILQTIVSPEDLFSTCERW
jgi:hypothetical protein